MADDDDTEEMFDGSNMSDDMKLDATIVKLADQYAGSLRRSKAENDERASIRANADKIGIPPKAFQQAVGMLRVMDSADLKLHQRGVRRMFKALAGKVADLFPDDVERQEKRAARKKEADAKAAAAAGGETPEAQERRIAADSNPRSKPKASSAKKAKPTKAELSAAAAAAAAAPGALDDEQAEGAAILDGAIDSIKDGQGLTGKTGMGSVADEVPLSQTALAAQKRSEAGLP